MTTSIGADAPTHLRHVVELRGVTRMFRDVVAVDGVDLVVEDGECLSILGPSGCGKSTLLRIVGGLDRPTAGRVVIEGVDVTRWAPERRPTATVFQSGAVFPHLTVYDNVAYPLAIHRKSRRNMDSRVNEMLRLTRLEALARRLPSELSGGQRQRVAVARALAGQPRVLLMDEPLSALDAALKRELQIELRRIHREVGVTILFVTHDQEEALVLSDRIAVMRDGRIEQCDLPEVLYRAPASEFVARFLGHANILPLERVDVAGGSLVRWGDFAFASAAAAQHSAAEPLAATVRPSALRLHAPGTPNATGCRIIDTVFLGDKVRLQARTEAMEVVWIETPAASADGYEAGSAVGVDFDPKDAAVIVRHGSA